MASSSPSDDGFREIQLNGKQLVFLFMAATVVSVVIFLCGVLVGRGVRPVSAEQSAAAAADVVAAEAPLPETPALPQASAAQPTAAEPPPTPDELSYYERLEKDGTPAETLKSPLEDSRSSPAKTGPAPAKAGLPPAKAAPAPAAPAERPPAAEPVTATTGASAPPTSAEPAGAEYAVQVAALRGRGEADTIAKRLSGKGYPVYVLSPLAGAPAAVYRVRVGKFKSRKEAEQVAARLEREEQFKPWILR